MRKWCTTIKAVNPFTGELLEWGGPNIPSPSRELAQEYCNHNGLGYCYVEDCWLVMEVPEKDNKPDWSKKIDFSLTEKN